MNSVDALDRRYAASISLVRYGVEIVAVQDREGSRFDRVVRRLVAAVSEDGTGLWADLVGASKALRWRLITEPQPGVFNEGLIELAREVVLQARRLQGAVADQDLLDEIAASATVLASEHRKSDVGTELLRTCLEVEPDACVVIAASRRAQIGLTSWLAEYGIAVMTASQLERDQPDSEQAYVVGPPRFFRSSLVTAPVTDAVSFLLPAWFGDRSIPRSAIAPYAQGAINIAAREYIVGDTSEFESDAPIEIEDEAAYLPQPAWGTWQSAEREPADDEVAARKVLLSGKFACWLDDGERIRSLDPRQPMGERVTYTDVAAVREGTYLLLRKGVTERGSLYQAALARMGPQAAVIDASQTRWKQLLAKRLQRDGNHQVVRSLHAAGINTADRARAWSDPSLVRPSSDQDFELLLKWLGIPIQPTFNNATQLRIMLYQANAKIRKQLEEAVDRVDLMELETAGHIIIDSDIDGVRSILASRVIAISPHANIVPKHDARVPFEDWSGQWLE